MSMGDPSLVQTRIGQTYLSVVPQALRQIAEQLGKINELLEQMVEGQAEDKAEIKAPHTGPYSYKDWRSRATAEAMNANLPLAPGMEQEMVEAFENGISPQLFVHDRGLVNEALGRDGRDWSEADNEAPPPHPRGSAE